MSRTLATTTEAFFPLAARRIVLDMATVSAPGTANQPPPLRTSLAHGAHALSWTEQRAGAHVARAALFYLLSQVEAGHGCPVSMTHGAVPALRASAPHLAAEWEPRLTSGEYDFGLRPAAQ